MNYPKGGSEGCLYRPWIVFRTSVPSFRADEEILYMQRVPAPQAAQSIFVSDALIQAMQQLTQGFRYLGVTAAEAGRAFSAWGDAIRPCLAEVYDDTDTGDACDCEQCQLSPWDHQLDRIAVTTGIPKHVLISDPDLAVGDESASRYFSMETER